MRLKSRTWFLISLLLFTASVWVWRYAEQRVARRASPPPRVLSRKTPADAPPPQLTRVNNKTTGKPGSYRLSNTPATAAQLARNEHGILLRNALIDTARPVRLDIPAHLRAKGAPGSYIVQSDRALDARFRAELAKAGATYVSYIPNNAALVQATPAQARQMLEDPEFQAVLPYEPYYKLDSALLPLAVEQAPAVTGQTASSSSAPPISTLSPASGESSELRVTTFVGQRDAALTALTALGANLIGEDNTPFGPTLIVKAPAHSLAAIAQLPLAQEIEPFTHRRELNDLTRVELGISADTLIGTTNYLGLTGSNVFVNMNDSGVEAGLPDFGPVGRVFGDSPNAIIDLDGHGTHVGGILAGGGNVSASVVTPPQGSVAGADFRGKAPQASLFVQQIDLLTGPFISDAYLQSNASIVLSSAAVTSGSKLTNGFISNNSWGYQNTFYDMSAASYDAAVRDAQPNLPGEQSLLFVFAAGNNGNGSGNGIDGTSGSITSPATAKNVITVGAIDSPRGITNEVDIPDDMLTNDPIWLSSTDNSNLVAYFSSCGDVGSGVEGSFGRFKPDVVAPGVFIVSDRARNFVDPSAEETLDYNNYPNNEVLPGQTNTVGIVIPGDALSVSIQVLPNAQSPQPFPALAILFDQNDPPTTLVGNGQTVTISGPFTAGNWYVGVADATNQQPVSYDLNTFIIETNALGTYYNVLSNLNSGLAPYYRFESGTSMAAPAVSGMLALMQQYLTSTLRVAPSPALLKAMLINGSRSLGNLYDFNTQPTGPNSQGWGLPNISNSIPASLASNNSSLLFIDQSPSNALATGQSHSYQINVTDPIALNSPLRVTLVWTDPPGDPAAGLALVNNLDLVVTDSTGTNVYIGNDFLGGDTFTEASNPTNAAASDIVNNVENVYIDTSIMPLSPPYTITVMGSRVNVNAVASQTNDIKQDYALVISSDDQNLQSPLALTDQGARGTAAPLITTANSGVPLNHQRVGANEPNLYDYPLGATNGNVSQWHFFIFVNNVYSPTNLASNVVFATFLPPNLSLPRNTDADIDLYASTNPALLTLDPTAIAGAQKSLNRGGNETIFYSNSVANETYYLGVKSEDQQAADFTFYGVAQEQPFATQVNGVTEATGTDLPMNIPDGSFDAPGVTNVIAFAPPSSTSSIARHVSVTLGVRHQNPGDLVGILTHPGTTETGGVTLHNHSGSPPGISATYDNAPENPALPTAPPDGPGTLQSFIGQTFTGQWMLQETDNSLGQTGSVLELTVNIEPQPPDGGAFTVTIPPNGWYYGFTNIPTDGTNLNIAVGFGSGGPVSIYITNTPNVNAGDYGTNGITPPGGSLNLSITNSPPLSGGPWYYGIYNGGGSPETVNVVITVQESLTPNLTETLTNDVPIALQTDAHTQSQICISNNQPLISVNVGVRIDDTNDLDNLVLHLISPQGASVLLFEDRGGTNAGALGVGETASNYVYTVFTEVTNLAPTLIKFAPPPYAMSNYTGPSTNFTGGFETVSNGVYVSGQTVEGWGVLTNEAEVISNKSLAHSGNNCLALASAQIFRTVTTVPGDTYQLQFVSRGAGITDWWPADGNTHDIIGNNDAALTPATSFIQGEVGEAFNFTNGNLISVNSNVGNFGTNDFTVEFWVRLDPNPAIGQPIMSKGCNCARNFWDIGTATNLSSQIGINAELSGDDCVGNVSVVGEGVADGFFHHIAMVRSPGSLSVYTDGVFDSSASGGAVNLDNTNMLTFGYQACPVNGGPGNLEGQLDEISFYNRALSDAEVYAIYHAGSVGKVTPVSVLPNVQVFVGALQTNMGTNAAGFFATNVSVGGITTNVIADNSDVWETNLITFVATGNSTTIEIAGNALGRLFDDFILTQLPATNYNNYYLPEEALSTFTGENPAGCWTLDVWDTRTDSSLSNNGVLLGWNMQMTFSATNVNLIVLTNRVAFTETVTNISADNGLASNIAYFAFDVPQLANYTTNVLINSTQPVNVFFNQTGLPTGSLPGDATLISGNSGSYTLSVNGPPPVLRAGQRYFLGVQYGSTPVTFTIEVSADVTTNISVTPLTNGIDVNTNILASKSPQYYSFYVPPDAVLASFEIINPTNEIDLYARHDLPIPSALSFDYEATYAGTNNESIVVGSNSAPVPLTSGTWYLAVYNYNATNVVNYTIVATYITNNPVIITLTNGLNPLTSNYTAAPGPDLETFYAYTIPTNSTVVTSLQFVLTNLTGNVDLLAQQDAFPTGQNLLAGSFNPGAEDEVVTLVPNPPSLPSLAGTWYLAVPNNAVNNVNFQILVTTNATTTASGPLNFSSVTISPTTGLITLCWNSVPGQQYTVEDTTDLVTWQPATSSASSPNPVTATSTTTCYTDPTPIDLESGRFYRLTSP